MSVVPGRARSKTTPPAATERTRPTDQGTSPHAVTTAPRARGDLGVLTVLLVVLFVIPSQLAFAPLGAAGSPAKMLGMALFLVWALRRVGDVRQRTTAVHWALLALSLCIVISYLVAAVRAMTGDETSSADRGLLSLLGWLGLCLTVADGLRTRADLDVFMRRVVVGGGFVAVVGLLQFVTKQQLTNYIVIPGLTDNVAQTLGDRGGFTRPTGTALHPIEFGAVLTMILPFALHFALSDTARSGWRRWWPVVAIAMAVPISISRSAIVSALVILLVLIPSWRRPIRHRAYVALFVLGAVMYVLVPGLLGTITGLFTSISDDGSTESRTDSYALAGEFIGRDLLFGRGFQTFLITYRILDNEYLGLLIQIGVVGTAAVLVLFGTTIRCSYRVRRRSADPATRSLALAFAASIASAAVSMALFDMFSFPMAVSVLFLLVGGAACLIRLTPARAATMGTADRGAMP